MCVCTYILGVCREKLEAVVKGKPCVMSFTLFFFNFNFYGSIVDLWASQMALVVKNPPANAGDRRNTGLIPGSRRFPGGGHGNPLQYSFLECPMAKGAWWATVHRVTKSPTRLK